MRGSVYVHFPYCLAKCPYCDFVSYKAARDDIDHAGYADAVIRELEHTSSDYESFLASRGSGSVQTIFFGGGTPSLWDPRELGRTLAAIRKRLPVVADVEITVECNPTSLDESRARALVDAGVNRVSIGTQSLDAAALKFLGRLHDPNGALAAIEGALRAGVPRVSTDLIFGLPEQSPEDARAQASQLAELGLAHLSCYQLTIEPGTQFGELARRGRLPLADDGRVADAFLAIDDALTRRGFRHYEISNYAKPGHEARHNLGYWRGEPYLGLGCAAYGTYAGARRRNLIDPAKYVEATRSAEAYRASVSHETLDAETQLKERIMLGLRMVEGFDLEAAAAELGVTAWTPERSRAAEWLVTRKRIVIDGGRVSVPRDAWLFADDTAARLF